MTTEYHKLTIAHVNRYFELGIVVHPLCPADHHCNSPGKIPFDPVEGRHMLGWQNHEQFHLDTWHEWLDYDSNINIGMLTGQASGLVGVDIDDEPGDEMVQELWHGETWEYTTGKGRRLLFRHTEPISRTRMRDANDRSFEILGDHTNNVLPPSEHASGRAYAWTPGLTPRDVEVAPLPPWARGVGIGVKSNSDVNSDAINWIGVIKENITKGQRNEVMTQIAGRLLAQAPLTQAEAYFLAVVVNEKYGKPPLSREEVKSVVRSIGKREMKSRKVDGREAWKVAREHDISIEQAKQFLRSKA